MNRIIGEISGFNPGPTIIAIGGIHGNETSGVVALEKLTSFLQDQQKDVCGRLIAIRGNLGALKIGRRYLQHDLNRIWGKFETDNIESGEWTTEHTTDDYKELVELYLLVKKILSEGQGPYIFADLHSVSSRTIPFITINDMLRNRRLSRKFPVPVVLGVEEYIKGSFLSRVNALGYTAVGFEAGIHKDPQTVVNQYSFMLLLLHYSEVYQLSQEELGQHMWQLDSELSHRFFEVRYRQEIVEGQSFSMASNFRNFCRINRNELLAELNGESLMAPFKGRLFLPLYQKQGSDGFFVVRRILGFALTASALLRKFNWTPLLLLFPGVTRHETVSKWIMVKGVSTRWLAIPIFHLLGYRCREQERESLCFVRRETPPFNSWKKEARQEIAGLEKRS